MADSLAEQYARNAELQKLRDQGYFSGMPGLPAQEDFAPAFRLQGTDLPPAPVRDESAARKTAPLATGCFDYFPAALWEVAQLSYWGNEKHNAGEALHDARSKSTDDADCLLRHFKDRGTWDVIKLKDGREVRVRHSAAVAWRALRLLQKECEADGAPVAPGAR